MTGYRADVRIWLFALKPERKQSYKAEPVFNLTFIGRGKENVVL